MGKGSNSTQSTASGTTNTSPAGPAYQAYLQALQMGQTAASAPYVPYSGQEVAPVNAQETAGIGTINQGVGTVQAAGAPLSQAAIQAYMNPYTQNVTNATEAAFANTNAQQQSQVLGNAAAQGALGGDRVGVAQALTAGQQAAAEAPVLAGIQSQGYSTALSTAQQQQGFGLTAAEAQLASAQPQIAAGQLQQQTQQAQDTQAMTDYFQQQGYPLQMAQYYAGLVTGVGSQLGGTSTTNQSGTTQGPTPNTFAQVAGLGLAGAAAFAARGGPILARRAGGRIAGFADGGTPAYTPEQAAMILPVIRTRTNIAGMQALPDDTRPYVNDVKMDWYNSAPDAEGRKAWVDNINQQAQAASDARAALTQGATGPMARGGRIRGMADGGVPGDPYAQSWVPSEGMTAGSGAPSAPQISFPSLPSQGQNQSSNPIGGALGLNQSQLQKGFSNIGSGISNGLENTSAFGTGTQDYLDDLADSPADAGSIGDYDRGGRVAGFASGGAPFSQYPSWVPSAQIQHGKGAPSPPSVSFPKAPAQQGLSASQLSSAGKGIGAFGKDAMNYYQTGAKDVSMADLYAAEPASESEPGLTSLNWRGGRVKRYAVGGFADGGMPDDDTNFDDRFYDRVAAPELAYMSTPGARSADIGYNTRSLSVPTTAGFGASSPAFDNPAPPPPVPDSVINPDNPIRLDPGADQAWRQGNKDYQNVAGPPPGLPNVIKTGASVPANDDDEPSAGLGYNGPPQVIHGTGLGSPAQAPSSDQPDQGGLFGHGGLLGTGIQMTPELRQGLLQAGLSMMATTRGGPGSFLGAAGEGGMAGVGAYEKSLQLAQEQAEKERQDAMRERELADREANQSLVKGPNGQYGINKPLLEFEKQKSEFNQKDNWSVLQGDGVTTPDRLFNKTTGEFKDVPPGKGQSALNAVQNGQFDYRASGPTLNKGDAVPEPIAVAGRSPDALKKDAETYLTNGQLPKASASPRTQAGVAQQQYARAVQNYGVALAESKGLTMTQLADLQRFGVNAARFPLSRQGDQTVAIGTAIRHISALEDYADAWDKAKGNVNAPIVREAAARFSKFLGKAEPTNLEQAASIAGPEIIKAIGVAGGGTGGERVAQEEGFRPGASTQQIHGAAGVARAFLAGQLPAKEAQARNVGFPHERFMDMVGPTEYDYLSAINHGGKTAADKPGAAAPERPSNIPANAVARQTSDGTVHWFDPDTKKLLQ